ncbi:MAG: sugar phosphate isomerase/epimerase [Phycisphaerales bacterium]|nr:sugar phosphate isomerase/epimerase [Phycisphaerales bacterium]
MVGAAIATAIAPTVALAQLQDGVEKKSAAASSRNRVSVAQWSLHRMLKDGTLAPLNFPEFVRTTFGVAGVEYVSTFYRAMAANGSWVADLRKRADAAGVMSLLIMCDGEGDLGDPDANARRRAVDAHRRWLDAAAGLGCHSIRVNARSVGTADEQCAFCADGLAQLSAVALPMKLNVIVENHGGCSCDGAWVARVIRQVGATNCGTLPDFGNFRCEDGTMADRYAGIAAMMPFARAVSAKSHDFNGDGFETTTDYTKMMGIVRGAGYTGWVGVEYEGDRLTEVEGAKATRDLLLKLGCIL